MTVMLTPDVRCMQVVLILLLTIPCIAFLPCMIPDCFQVGLYLNG